MAKKVKGYDPAFKEMDSKRHASVGEDRLIVSEAAKEFDIKPSSSDNWLNNMHRTPEPAKKVSEPTLPRGITSIRQALGIGLYCEELCLDSPEAELYCRQKGCTLEEIKDFLKWADILFEDEQKLKQFPVISATIGSSNVINEESQDNIKEDEDDLAQRDKLISEIKAQVVLRTKFKHFFR